MFLAAGSIEDWGCATTGQTAGVRPGRRPHTCCWHSPGVRLRGTYMVPGSSLERYTSLVAQLQAEKYQSLIHVGSQSICIHMYVSLVKMHEEIRQMKLVHIVYRKSAFIHKCPLLISYSSTPCIYTATYIRQCIQQYNIVVHHKQYLYP